MHPDLKKVKGWVVMSKVDDESIPSRAFGLRIFLLAERMSYEPIKVRIPKTDNTDALVAKVNSLQGKTVDVVYNRYHWSINDQRGITNYLQSIEESDQ